MSKWKLKVRFEEDELDVICTYFTVGEEWLQIVVDEDQDFWFNKDKIIWFEAVKKEEKEDNGEEE